MRRKILIGILCVTMVFIGLVIFEISTFSLFDLEIEEISTLNVSSKKIDIGIYYLSSNTSSEEYIQVRKIENNIESVIQNFKRYDSVVKSELKGDSLICLVLKDTDMKIVKQDTFLIPLK
jgi:hypothetical protein